MYKVETLKTKRLILRMWRREDFDSVARLFSDPEVMRFISPRRVMTRSEAWGSFAYSVGHWHLRGFGYWAVEEKESGHVVGRVGFGYPEEWHGVEFGWTFAREYWGRGYASEAARRALQYCFTKTDLEHVVSSIQPENVASIRVAERLGEELEGENKIGGFDHLIYGISREKWRQAAASC
ncbi:MAG TPA: GNAT family N-acetyltransferase [Pyrinomonadaceae bacterium]|nr:GNAT family N-acetyltransferase [Pyrinomonadaceae bacterium]